MALERPKVDFFVIGAARSGTTSIYRALSTHPKIFQSEIKEPRFFNTNWSKGWGFYRSVYKGATPDMICGDYSPSYSNSPDATNPAARRIADHYPKARIIYMVRNPIECAISNWRMTAEIEKQEIPFRETLSNSWQAMILNRSMFHQQIQHYRNALADEQILVVPLELARVHSEDWMTKVQRHIGIPEEALQSLTFTRANRSDMKPNRPATPEISLEDRQHYLDLVREDSLQFLDYIGQPETLWDLSTSSKAWTKGAAD